MYPIRILYFFLLLWSQDLRPAQGLLALDRSSPPTAVPLLYSALLRMGGGFFSTTSYSTGVEKEVRGEGQLGFGLPRVQLGALYIESDYDYLQHWIAQSGVGKDTTVLQREHRLSPSVLFSISSQWTLGLFGFYSWVLQGKKGGTQTEAYRNILHSQSLYPWVAYAWNASTQSILYGILQKKFNEEDPWLSYQTWNKKERQVSFGVVQEIFWQGQYVALQAQRLYFRCNDFWQDRKEDQLGLYAQLRKHTVEVPIFVGWGRKEYVFPRIRMQQTQWQRSHPVSYQPKGEYKRGSAALRWNFYSFWWVQGEVRSTYDTMSQNHSWDVQLSFFGVLGRAWQKREVRDELLRPFSHSF